MLDLLKNETIFFSRKKSGRMISFISQLRSRLNNDQVGNKDDKISSEDRRRDIQDRLQRRLDFTYSQLGHNAAWGESIPFVCPFDGTTIVGNTTRPQEDQFNVERSLQVTNDTSFEDEESGYGKEWILRKCKEHIAQKDSQFSAEDICVDIFSILRKNQNDDEIQMSLVDLLGYDNFEFLRLLLTHRQDILDAIYSEFAKNTDNLVDNQSYKSETKQPMPALGAQITVTTKSEKEALKAARKENIKLRKKNKFIDFENVHSATLVGLEGLRLRQVHEEKLQTSANAPLFSSEAQLLSEKPKYPNVYQSGDGGSVLSIFATRYVLPEGTQRIEENDYEEIRIPAPDAVPPRSTERRIKISEMDDLCREAYKSYESLNRVQSIVYPIAYETNENMLVCAPTGAGKTDVAMLTILRTISQHTLNDRISLKDFKIVYVAPMKALAAEVVRKFSSRLAGLNIKVRELTGDMQLTRAEISDTQMLVTTPEKWDVVTRKSTGDTDLTPKVKLLIIDEVHLLHEQRGAVIETLVTRTQRLVESMQKMIRVVGLSATLPNYVDVADFLCVNPYKGLFFFDSSFRPVPLEQYFVGIKGKVGSTVANSKMDSVCFDKALQLIHDGHQVMIFVHSRKDTVRTAEMIRRSATESDNLSLFDSSEHEMYGIFNKEVQKSRNKEMKELFNLGLGIHHAGMLRSDRTLSERMFEKGVLKVLCCTATLAWGVNLPAYGVIIKGTNVYSADKGAFIDLSILDVLQIFGRAGRPQYEDQGVGYIITSHDRLSHYVSSITQQHPIESKFAEKLVDNLNAEISLGTVTNIDDSVRWLSYTYLYVRMRKNPFHYGIDWKELHDDPHLGKRRREMVVSAARVLNKAEMIIFDERTGELTSKNLGRIASNFYISHQSVQTFNRTMRPRMTEADALSMLSMSTEFDNIKIRNEEYIELKKIHDEQCICAVKGGIDTSYGKTNVLLQAYISRVYIEDFALVSDTMYIAKNAVRILRALFKMAMSRNWGWTAGVILSLCKTVDKRLWPFEHGLCQFDLPSEIMDKIQGFPERLGVEAIRDMDPKEIGDLVRHYKGMGETLKRFAKQFPVLELRATIQPLASTNSSFRVSLEIKSDFEWSEKVHGQSENWWIWVEDPGRLKILHAEYFVLTKMEYKETQRLSFNVPIPEVSSTTEGLKPEIYVRALSENWIGAETSLSVSYEPILLGGD